MSSPCLTSSNLARVNSQDQALYWTDDIPVCHLSAVGHSTNQIYRDNAPARREGHECEDSSFRFRPDNDVYLYGVFDGHDGNKLSNFAAQRFPAEILLGQLSNKMDDEEEVLNVLHQAFMSVEKAYLDSISDQLAQKCNLQEQLPALENMTSPDAAQLYNDVMARLGKLEEEISGGTSAVVALIIKNKLYVASVGCCRALLCKTSPEGKLRVVQLTVDHDLNNVEELQRLADMGIDVDQITKEGKIGNHPFTRTIGDYNIKIGYKDIDVLSTASSDPVIAEPEISNGIELDESCCFLILTSSGIHKTLEEAGTPNINVTLASAVASEFSVQSTLCGVAQGVVDRLARIHHDTYMTNSDNRIKERCSKREDMTLLLRKFNYVLPNAASSTPTFSPSKTMTTTPLSVVIPSNNDTLEEDDHRPMFTVGSMCGFGTGYSTQQSNTYTSSNDSSEDCRLMPRPSQFKNPMPLDDEGKIKSYVDFESFYEVFNQLKDEEKEAFMLETEPKPAYETIPEERELMSPNTTGSQTNEAPPSSL